MKTTPFFLLAIMAVSFFCGCKKGNPAPANSASVMFVNGCAGTLPGIDAKVDNVNVSGAANITFTGNSGYKYVKAGAAVTLGIYLTNSGTPVTAESVSITTNKHYSAFSAGLITSPSFLFTQDDMSAPASNTVKVRFVNLSKDTLSYTANAQNTVIGSGITSLKITSFAQVPAGNYELKAGDPSNINSFISTDPKTLSLAAGRIYTLMLTGTLAGTGASALKLTLVNNN